MGPKHQPWDIEASDFPEKENLESQIKFVLNYAVLAPSTHNTQPWLFKIKESECQIYYNPKLALPEADSKMRDLYISMGCCIENLILASSYFNIFESISYGPFEEKEHVAAVRFKKYAGNKNAQYEKIVNAILERINARGIFSKEKVPNDLLDKINFIVKDYLVDGIDLQWVREDDKIRELALLTANGLKIAYAKPSFRREMSGWINSNLTKRKEGIPGYALKMPLILSFVFPKLVKWFNVGNLLAQKNYLSLKSAPLAVVIASDIEGPAVWLKIGRLAERLMIEFNSFGWQTSIFVAAIEMGQNNDIKKIINSDRTPQFLFVVGKVDSLHKKTPRHPLEEKIIHEAGINSR